MVISIYTLMYLVLIVTNWNPFWNHVIQHSQLTIPLTCTVISLSSFFPPVIKMCANKLTCYEFNFDHAVIKCTIDFPSSLANCQTSFSFRRYHCINMSNFRSDLKEMPLVKCPANSVSQLYDQYVYDLSCIFDRHAPLVSNLKMK